MQVKLYRSPVGRPVVQQFLESLPKPDQARFADLLQGIMDHGLDYDRCRFRQLQGKLWEIKFHSAGGDWRVAYVLVDQDLMVWLHAFRKESRRTKGFDLDLALKRMREVTGG